MKLHTHPTRNILLIDDDEDDRLLLNLALEKVSDQVSLVCLSCTSGLSKYKGKNIRIKDGKRSK